MGGNVDLPWLFDSFGTQPCGTDLSREATDRVKLIQQRLVTAQSRQKSMRIDGFVMCLMRLVSKCCSRYHPLRV